MLEVDIDFFDLFGGPGGSREAALAADLIKVWLYHYSHQLFREYSTRVKSAGQRLKPAFFGFIRVWKAVSCLKPAGREGCVGLRRENF